MTPVLAKIGECRSHGTDEKEWDLIALILGMTLSQAIPPATMVETGCQYTGKVSGKPGIVDAPALHVLTQTAGPGAFKPDVPEGSAIICTRNDIVPAANDWKVLAADHAFCIVVEAPSGNRRLWLEIINGRLQVSMRQGTLTEAEQTRVQAWLNETQPFFYKK